jgi:tetratricopeptide (TPR) repeat protein
VGKRGLRPQGQRLVVAVLVVLLAAAAGLALLQKWPGAAWQVIGGAAAVAVIVGGAGPIWQRRREQRMTGTGVIRRSVRTSARTVAELSLDELRVHTAVVDVPYLPRARKEREAGEHLRARRPVVIVGPSMVGKTRLAAAVVGEVLPSTPVLIPDTPTALSDLDQADIVVRDRVIWLDDLERFLSGGGITAGLVRRLAGANWLVATLRAHEWDRFQPTDQLRLPEWDVLRLFEVVTLDRRDDGPADEDLRRAFPDPDVRARIARTGIGEYAGAAQHVRHRLTTGAHANPLGHALVVGAADWSRLGLTPPVPADLLPRLAAPHLTDRQRLELADDAKYRNALDWATREINPTVSLLEPVDGAYRVYDFALDELAAGHPAVPVTTWQLAIDSAGTDGLYSLGFQAMVNHGLPALAERAFTKSAEAGNTMAMTSLGVLLLQHGRLDEAEHRLREAAGAGDTDAMSNLGLLRQQRGDPVEAERWLRRAAEAGHPTAMSNLGVLLVRQHDRVAEAERWFRRAAATGQQNAIFNLSVLSELKGRDPR